MVIYLSPLAGCAEVVRQGVPHVKIALNFRQESNQTPEVERERSIERDVEGCRRNDWEAKTRLIQTFMPLLTSLARKRTQETAGINRYIEAGKEGLIHAARHYKGVTGVKFQVFALDYIEKKMNRMEHPGFFSRLFGRS
jgi:DNA-directed RNA polymerase sigma subunit (sigma70/sigma32)